MPLAEENVFGSTDACWRVQLSAFILVVDDEPDVEAPTAIPARSARRSLRDGICAIGPDGASAHYQCWRQSLILILSDINMPGMSGLELLPRARALRPDVPIIMITAYGDAETKRRALENGAEALLTKPIDFGKLRSEINSRVERAA
jgi:CheY-like chemotaxis protein